MCADSIVCRKRVNLWDIAEHFMASSDGFADYLFFKAFIWSNIRPAKDIFWHVFEHLETEQQEAARHNAWNS